jgi:hypothetical protein
MNKFRMLWAGVAALTLALVVQFTVYYTAGPTGTAHAVWAFQPKNFGEVVNKAQVVVEAQVVAVNKGPDIVMPVQAEPSGKVAIPTQHITVQVLKADKGAVSAGQQLTVFHTGGPTNVPTDPPAGAGKGDPNAAPPPSVQVNVLMLDDDPAYQVGERYFLLMEAGPDGTLRPVSPEGRYHINADSTLTPVSGSDVAKSMSGRTVQDALASAKGGSN